MCHDKKEGVMIVDSLEVLHMLTESGKFAFRGYVVQSIAIPLEKHSNATILRSRVHDPFTVREIEFFVGKARNPLGARIVRTDEEEVSRIYLGFYSLIKASHTEADPVYKIWLADTKLKGLNFGIEGTLVEHDPAFKMGFFLHDHIYTDRKEAEVALTLVGQKFNETR